MISQRASDSLRRAWHKAGRLRLVQRPDGDHVDICGVPAAELLACAPDVVLITISSLDFRLLVLLGLHDSPQARQYYGDGAFGEIANLACGVISQELQQVFPDLGMSTPCLLRAASLPHLAHLQPQWLDGYRVRINGDVQVSAVLCLLGTDEVDFQFDVLEADQTGSGELELF
jgi:hypothetical protein